jgi:hypothetical protein
MNLRVMHMLRQLALLLVLVAGLAYTVEASLPALAAFTIENSSEETAAKETTEILAPAKTESRKVTALTSAPFEQILNITPVKVNYPQTVVTPKTPRPILHRALLI